MRVILVVLVAFVSLSCFLRCVAAESVEEQPKHTEEPADRDACAQQLTKIYGAIQQYREKYKRLPMWLSDLKEEFIHDPDLLVCPHVRKTGHLKEWRKGYHGGVFGDPFSSYGYEFCSEPAPYQPTRTIQDFKRFQMRIFGFNVPIARCWAHRPVLNLAYDGNVYECRADKPVFWEDNFERSDEEHDFFHTIPSSEARFQELLRQQLPPAAQGPDRRRVDLSSAYNCPLKYFSQVSHRGDLLVAHPEGLQKVGGTEFDCRGLVHLSANYFPVLLPERIDDIQIEQKCRRIHFLHGSVLEAPFDSKIASLLVRFDTGQKAEVPIIYGRDVKTCWFDFRRKSELENPTVAWTSPSDKIAAGGRALRLYHKSWENPHPASRVESISFVSLMKESAPFLIAITLGYE